MTTHVVALTGSASTVQLSASSLTFTSQSIGTASAPQTITVTNVGTSPLSVSGVVASSDFTESDNCTKAPLQPSTNCVISVTYAPTTAGSALGALTVTDNVPGSPQVVVLNGTGLMPDFSMASQAASEIVVAGQSTSFTVDIASVSGFAQSLSLSCSGAGNSSLLDFALFGYVEREWFHFGYRHAEHCRANDPATVSWRAPLASGAICSPLRFRPSGAACLCDLLAACAAPRVRVRMPAVTAAAAPDERVQWWHGSQFRVGHTGGKLSADHYGCVRHHVAFRSRQPASEVSGGSRQKFLFDLASFCTTAATPLEEKT